MKTSIVKILLVVLVLSTVASSCSIFGKGRKDKSCMCPNYR
ncbi:MAG TPA: hypothetical protein PKG56_01565 [Chitinophagaceae bacterium]|nr:hypothetical protein [Chitinophagaceae bacterium]HNE92724.1 hypothetical protein [Chitinophagaceae bacterium]HNF30157.1 hypothetical protein [Chitinophagaceae bacterium]HNL82054.1 hypothetical protein [Chitinophagaceae bacterium]HNM34448.1 hypothetical protein [Chitinophagaceae bacterium]